MIYQRRCKKVEKIAVIGNYLPRQCGIATFTTDISLALAKELSVEENLINIAIDDLPQGHNYPPQVKFRIREQVQEDYFWAADYLNANQFEAAIIQHEFGIFGGKDGEYILQLAKSLKMPVITNLHTVLERPSTNQRRIIMELARYSDKFTVMNKRAIRILTRIYGIDEKMIEFIPHGIPDGSFEDPGLHNNLFGLEDKDVILTFGLLGPDKGIETMIKAMPSIVKEHPNAVYLVLGQTHPNIIKYSGDSYRESLQNLVKDLNMENHVIFHNEFAKLDMLVKYIQTSKIYAIPYLKKEQITSGTLSYAMGLGAAVVSTPFWHAEELLADGRGKFVSFSNSEEMASAINELLSDDYARDMMRFKGYQLGRSMTWKEVCKMQIKLISDIKEKKLVETPVVETINNKTYKIPEINLAHLKNMSDGTGLLQHAKYTTPDFRHGYCVDDNARGLVALTQYYSMQKDSKENETVLNLIQKYLAFLFYAFNHENCRFRNFMSYDRRWLELTGSEDSHARALWGLGVTVKEAPNHSVRKMAMRLFSEALPIVKSFTSPRSWAYTILGLQDYLSVYGGDSDARKMRSELARKIYQLFKNNATEDWVWCEHTATYANAVLPHALILAGKWIPDRNMHDMGLKSLEWLLKVQTAPEGHLSVIGNNGWLDKSGNRSTFDQQPIEVKSLISACLDAYQDTQDKKWLNEAQKCFSWFLGQNDLQLPVCDYKTGGCADGLETQGINSNQGAESTLAWLISLTSVRKVLTENQIFEESNENNIKRFNFISLKNSDSLKK